MSIAPCPLALLLAPPGHLWQGLRLVLANCPDIVLAKDQAQDHAQALALMCRLAPTLAVLDFGLPGDGLALLTILKRRWPATRYLVIVENLGQLELARAASADCALLRGFQTRELYSVIHNLLPALPLRVEDI
jgi:DNA-binding NarL/FixJ family response regulator